MTSAALLLVGLLSVQGKTPAPLVDMVVADVMGEPVLLSELGSGNRDGALRDRVEQLVWRTMPVEQHGNRNLLAIGVKQRARILGIPKTGITAAPTAAERIASVRLLGIRVTPQLRVTANTLSNRPVNAAHVAELARLLWRQGPFESLRVTLSYDEDGRMHLQYEATPRREGSR